MSSIRGVSEVGSERFLEGWIRVMQVDVLMVLRIYTKPSVTIQDWREIQGIKRMLSEVQMFKGNAGINPNASG